MLAYWLPVVTYASGIFILSSFSRPPTPPSAEKVANFAEIVHFTEYAGLAALLYFAIGSLENKTVRRNTAWVAMAAAFIYAATDETHQSFVPGRSATINDWLVDCVGALVVLVMAMCYTSIIWRKKRRSQGA